MSGWHPTTFPKKRQPNVGIPPQIVVAKQPNNPVALQKVVNVKEDAGRSLSTGELYFVAHVCFLTSSHHVLGPGLTHHCNNSALVDLDFSHVDRLAASNFEGPKSRLY